MGLEEVHQMKQTTLEIMEFALNTCLKTFLIEGK
jgi:hypothetical protein